MRVPLEGKQMGRGALCLISKLKLQIPISRRRLGLWQRAPGLFGLLFPAGVVQWYKANAEKCWQLLEMFLCLSNDGVRYKSYRNGLWQESFIQLHRETLPRRVLNCWLPQSLGSKRVSPGTAQLRGLGWPAEGESNLRRGVGRNSQWPAHRSCALEMCKCADFCSVQPWAQRHPKELISFVFSSPERRWYLEGH